VDVKICYAPLANEILQAVEPGPLVLMIDSTKLGGRCLCLLASSTSSLPGTKKNKSKFWVMAWAYIGSITPGSSGPRSGFGPDQGLLTNKAGFLDPAC
jgi:hypothetical protein